MGTLTKAWRQDFTCTTMEHLCLKSLFTPMYVNLFVTVDLI